MITGGTGATVRLVWKNAAPKEFWRYFVTGAMYDAACGFSLTLTDNATIARYDHYIDIAQVDGAGADLGGRLSEHMRYTHAPGVPPLTISDGTEPPQDFDVSYDPAMFPPFIVLGTPQDGSWVFDLQFAAGGKITLRRWRASIRERITQDFTSYLVANEVPGV